MDIRTGKIVVNLSWSVRSFSRREGNGVKRVKCGNHYIRPLGVRCFIFIENMKILCINPNNNTYIFDKSFLILEILCDGEYIGL